MTQIPTIQNTEITRIHFLRQKVNIVRNISDLRTKSECEIIAHDIPISNLELRAAYDWFIPDKHPVDYICGTWIEYSEPDRTCNYLLQYRRDLFENSHKVNKFNPEGLPIFVALSAQGSVI